jgi:hypothetical protein
VLASDGVRCRLELPADWLSHGAESVSGAFPTAPEISREHIESALRAVERRIRESQSRLFWHGKLMERLQARGIDLTMAKEVELSLKTGLRLLQVNRSRLPGAWGTRRKST